MDSISVLAYAVHVKGFVRAQITLEINLLLMHTLNVVLQRAGVNGRVVALAAFVFFCQAVHRFGMSFLLNLMLPVYFISFGVHFSHASA